MSHELFVELSDEQQQLVAGGASLIDSLGTYFKQKQTATALSVTQLSGPGGSYNVQNFATASNLIKTGAHKNFIAYLP